MPALALGDLFLAPVMIADIEDGVHDLFAVELQDDAQNAVGPGVVRTQVEEHEVPAVPRRGKTPLLGPEPHGVLLFDLSFVGERVPSQFGAARGVLLPERMAFPGGRHQDAAEMGMAFRADAEHVPELAFVPVRGLPEPGYARDGKVRPRASGTLILMSWFRSKERR